MTTRTDHRRREFLRFSLGTVSGAVALPFLPSLSRGEEPRRAPKRLVCAGTQLGWYKPAFFAREEGDARLVEPFDEAGVGDRITTVAGLDHKGPTGNGHDLVYTLFTGQVRKSVSLDQYVAPRLGAGARHESLQLCAGEQPFNAPMSLNERGIPLPPILRPSVLYSKVFGGDAASLARQRYLLESGRSLLDGVTADARRMSGTLGKGDRGKLEEYLTSVRDVERKLARRRDWLDKPFPKPDPGFELPEEENVAEAMLLENEDLMWDLMALAIRNDSCRVFSLTIPLASSALVLGNGLTSSGYHNLSHHGNKKAKVDELVAIERAHMAGAARFLKALAEAEDVDGTKVADNTTLLVGSAMADAARHRRVDFPLMIAGGGYRHRRHVDCGPGTDHRNEMACDLYVTVLQHLGFETDSFATSRSNLNEVLL